MRPGSIVFHAGVRFNRIDVSRSKNEITDTTLLHPRLSDDILILILIATEGIVLDAGYVY